MKHTAARVHACLEATGAYGEALSTYLHEAGHTVSVINPAAIKAYGVGSSLKDLRDLPEEVKDEVGFALYQVQRGFTPQSAKALRRGQHA
jgi:transposase